MPDFSLDAGTDITEQRAQLADVFGIIEEQFPDAQFTPSAANTLNEGQTYTVGEGNDYSTADMSKDVRTALNRAEAALSGLGVSVDVSARTANDVYTQTAAKLAEYVDENAGFAALKQYADESGVPVEELIRTTLKENKVTIGGEAGAQLDRLVPGDLDSTRNKLAGAKADLDYALAQRNSYGNVRYGGTRKTRAQYEKWNAEAKRAQREVTRLENELKTERGGKIRYLARKSDSEIDGKKITANMTDAERVNILRGKTIYAPYYEGKYDGAIERNASSLRSVRRSTVRAAIEKVAAEFSLFENGVEKYSIEDISVNVVFSKGNLDESANKRVTDAESLAKLLPVLEATVSNSVGVEMHVNRYYADTNTKVIYELMGGYLDGDHFVPVRFGVKEFVDGSCSLYVVVCQDKIEKTKVMAPTSPEIISENDGARLVQLNIPQVAANVNSIDLLRYLPDGLLSDDQKEAKYKGIADTIRYTNNKNDAAYSKAIAKGDIATAQSMVNAAAKAAGYTVKAYHGTDERFTEFSPDKMSPVEGSYFFAENREDAQAYGENVMEVFLKADNPADYDNQPHEFYRLRDKKAQVEYLKRKRYDGWAADMDSGGWGEYSVFYPNQIKSAEAIVYDDDGNVIPLSKRFDDSSNDIRYLAAKPRSAADIVKALDKGQYAQSTLNSLAAQAREYVPDFPLDAGTDITEQRAQLADVFDIIEEQFPDAQFTPVPKAQARQKTPGDMRFLYAGENARTADTSALDRAKSMIADGADPETVRQETGWFRGMDGKWRFEIDDSGARYYQAGDSKFAQMHRDYARHQELESKFVNGEITPEEHAELRSLNEIWGRERGRLNERVDRNNATLENILRHDALFEAYPALRDAKIKFADFSDGTRGEYDHKTNTITVSSELRSAPLDTLLHEIQHAIQRSEGFTPGASVEYWQQQRAEIIETLAGARRNLELFLNDIGYKEHSHESMMAVVRKEKTLEQHWADMQKFKESSIYAKQIATCEEEISEFQKQYNEITGNMTASEQYFNTAGEIEARDVAARRNLSEAERRSTRPDIDRSDVLFADEIGYNESRKKYFSAIQRKLE